jgi:hypothetical protein
MGKAIRVLLVEDSADDRDLVLRTLRSGGYEPQIRCVETPEQLSMALVEGPWDVVISDYSLPRMNAPLALGILNGSALDIPFIVLTGSIGEDRAAAIMKAGAHDFILKHQLARLTAAIEREVGEATLRAAHREALLQLKATNQELSALVQASPVAIVTLGRGQVVRRWNSAATAVFGWKSSEMEGRALSIVPPACRAEFTAMTTSVMGGAAFAAVEMRWQRQDGTDVDISISMAPLRAGSGDADGIILMVADMTQRKRLEAQLHQTQKMEVVGQLAGGIAHDFNNLLTVINGRSQRIIAAVKESGPVRRDAELILDTGERAARLTRQLLAFSRRQVFQMKQVDLNRAVNDMRKMLSTLITENIELVTDITPGLPTVWTDDSQLEQVILNLAVNARDAMPAGGRLTITTARTPAETAATLGLPGRGPFVRLTVADTGTGIDAHTLPHLFEPFFTTKPQGTGLGLSTVDGIVRQSGGCIRVDSVPGRGSAFTIHLPASTQAGGDEESSNLNLAAMRKDLTVLVVEDNGDVRDVIFDALSSHGYKVISAADWSQALAAVEARTATIDLLLTDLIMPQVSGREVAARLQPLCPGMKVLFMSGYSQEMLGANHAPVADMPLIQKPFSPRKLIKEVHRALRAATT